MAQTDPSHLLALPRELRDIIIFWAFKRNHEFPELGPIIRIQGVPSVPDETSFKNGQVYDLKWFPTPPENTCQLACANRQLNTEVEEVLFSKFVFLFASGVTSGSLKTFFDPLSANARNHIRHLTLYFGFPMAPPHLNPEIRSHVLNTRLWVEMLPSEHFHFMSSHLPQVKRVGVLLDAARPSDDALDEGRALYKARLVVELGILLEVFGGERLAGYLPTVVVNIVNLRDGVDEELLVFSIWGLKRVQLRGNVSILQIEFL